MRGQDTIRAEPSDAITYGWGREHAEQKVDRLSLVTAAFGRAAPRSATAHNTGEGGGNATEITINGAFLAEEKSAFADFVLGFDAPR